MNWDKVKLYIQRFITNGLENELTHDELRRIKTVNAVGVVLLLTVLAFVFFDFFVFHKPIVAVVELLGFVTGAYFLYIQRKFKSVNFTTNMTVAIMVVVLIGINLLTGLQSSSTFWLYLIPPFAFFVTGVMNGFFWSGTIVLWLILMINLARLGIYGAVVTQEFVLDLIGSLTIVSALSFFFEYARKNAISDLTATNEEMRRLTYIVSHDLRTPLTALRGYARFLREDINTENELEINMDIERIELMAENMGKMIDDLLNLSRVGRHIEHKIVVNTREIVDLIILENETALHEKMIRVHISEPLPRLYLNKRKFEEVVRNLISNAIKYMGDSDDPYIEVGAVDKVHEHHFYVRDHGIGIEKKYHEKIFGLFVRHELVGQGSGIGLSIVRGFVEDMGGKVWIDSKPGAGSTFWFSLLKETSPEPDLEIQTHGE